MICFDKCVTVFSFNGKSYDRYVFDGVSVFGTEGIEVTDSGFKQNSLYKIRIPAEDELNLKCGDRVLLGMADVFDADNAYTIMKITDNRKGSFKHYLLTVK